MASAWGFSWGAWWGNSWGEFEPLPPDLYANPRSGGGAGSGADVFRTYSSERIDFRSRREIADEIRELYDEVYGRRDDVESSDLSDLSKSVGTDVEETIEDGEPLLPPPKFQEALYKLDVMELIRVRMILIGHMARIENLDLETLLLGLDASAGRDIREMVS